MKTKEELQKENVCKMKTEKEIRKEIENITTKLACMGWSYQQKANGRVAIHALQWVLGELKPKEEGEE